MRRRIEAREALVDEAVRDGELRACRAGEMTGGEADRDGGRRGIRDRRIEVQTPAPARRRGCGVATEAAKKVLLAGHPVLLAGHPALHRDVDSGGGGTRAWAWSTRTDRRRDASATPSNRTGEDLSSCCCRRARRPGRRARWTGPHIRAEARSRARQDWPHITGGPGQPNPEPPFSSLPETDGYLYPCKVRVVFFSKAARFEIIPFPASPRPPTQPSTPPPAHRPPNKPLHCASPLPRRRQQGHALLSGATRRTFCSSARSDREARAFNPPPRATSSPAGVIVSSALCDAAAHLRQHNSLHRRRLPSARLTG
ncbi:hypothetical protein E2562_027018 [Oryza meyeriana var. granulata]|uniref:Uncharacterized protein n=1 Tax=Oryza meyeriana var. granulata TaxID=110450 RepID=A0A6G1CAM5_9ORYZ|nr:hypothetical protein E2562_027018 [Oryza meyeriana var. granulata]